MANGIAFYDKDFFVIKKDRELVAESITRIIMTNPGERVGQPFFGVGLRNMLFRQIDEDLISDLKKTINDQMSTYEPRASVTEIDIIEQADENRINIKLTFIMKGDPPTSTNILTYAFDLE